MTSPATQLVQIEKPVYGGAFLARAEGKAVFVPLTLPGEQARVRIVEDKRGYATAEAEEIVAAAPERIGPKCPHFGSCGGCSYQHTDYETQLSFKRAILRETLERGGVQVGDEIGMLAGDPWCYRNRVRLAFDGAGNPGYRGRRSHSVIPIRECPIAAPALIDAAIGFADVRRKLTPVLQPTELSLFCNTDQSAILASLFVSHRAKFDFEGLARAWQEKASALRGVELVVEGRNGQQPRTVAQWGADSLLYRAAGFDYRVDHGAFFQVNRWLVDALVERATQARSGKVAWDLFAGVGLFARQLAANFERVIAVESAPGATAALTHNLHGSTGEALRSPTLDFLRRNTRAPRPDLIVVDPPRTGLGAETTNLLASIGAPAMVYVSCDPATLTRDLKALTGSGYSIESVTLADLFPQTFHLETVVELRRA
jgi:23S rRNA (uracil1939-C5)-methyltransferase